MFDCFSFDSSQLGCDHPFFPLEHSFVPAGGDYHSQSVMHPFPTGIQHTSPLNIIDYDHTDRFAPEIPHLPQSYLHLESVSDNLNTHHCAYAADDHAVADTENAVQQKKAISEQWFDNSRGLDLGNDHQLCTIHGDTAPNDSHFPTGEYGNTELNSAVHDNPDRQHDLFILTPDGDYQDVGEATEDIDGTGVKNTVIKNIGTAIVTYTDYDGDGYVDAINEISPDGTNTHYDLVSGHWLRKDAS